MALGTDLDYPQLVLVAVAGTVALALAVAAFTSGASFGAYNPQWDGASDLRAQADAVGADAVIARDVARYDAADVDAADSVAVVLSPETGYTRNESARVRRFVEAGGTLVVAEDVGPHGNALLADVGADARVDGRPVRDEREYYREPAMPVATNVTNETFVGTDRLTLNYGTVVRPGGARVLVRTSPFAYVDANRNDALDDGESLASMPVVTTERVGNGTVVVVSDPSALINAMLDRDGNRAYVRAQFRGHETVLLDYSHAERLPPLAAALLVVRESAVLQVLIGAGLVGAVGLWARWPAMRGRGVGAEVRARLYRRPTVDRPGLTREEVRAYLERRHPDWDDDRTDRVVDATLRRLRQRRHRDD